MNFASQADLIAAARRRALIARQNGWHGEARYIEQRIAELEAEAEAEQ